MNIADIFIYIAGLLWTIETIPQIIGLIKTKETAGISLIFFVMCETAYVFFLTGNIILKQWSIIISHSIPFINVGIIIGLVIYYRYLEFKIIAEQEKLKYLGKLYIK